MQDARRRNVERRRAIRHGGGIPAHLDDRRDEEIDLTPKPIDAPYPPRSRPAPTVEQAPTVQPTVAPNEPPTVRPTEQQPPNHAPAETPARVDLLTFIRKGIGL